MTTFFSVTQVIVPIYYYTNHTKVEAQTKPNSESQTFNFTMSNETSKQQSQPIIDPFKHFNIILNPDNTLTRLENIPNTLPSSDTTLPISVFTKDLTMSNDTIGVVVASVEYRLAPEHRLPAAYDDAVEALFWIRKKEDEWLKKYVDYSKCYVMGNSAGGTIAYHAGLRVVEEVKNLEPLKIQGLILRQPFFGGTKRTTSELKLANNPIIPMCTTDMMWDLALPIGANQDHEYSNLRVGNGLEKFHKMRDLGWKVLVSGNGEDPIVDRGKELVELMKEKGVYVISDFQDDGYHGVEYSDPLKAKKFFEVMKGFIDSFDA